jgi:ankyrin repeat protein
MIAQRSVFAWCGGYLCIWFCQLSAMTTPLHTAVSQHDFKAVINLVNQGTDVSVCDAVGNTPLHTAACYGCDIIAHVLLHAGANVNALNNYGEQPLHMAAYWGHLKALTVLLEEGAFVDACSDSGNTPLHYAALHGWVDVVGKLLDSGANCMLRNSEGNTPLHCAVINGTVSVVKLFISFSIEKKLLEIRNKCSQTALGLACEEFLRLENAGDERRYQIVDLLENEVTTFVEQKSVF